MFQDLRALTARATRVRASATRAVPSGGQKTGGAKTTTSTPKDSGNEPSDEAVAAALAEEGKLLLKQKFYHQAGSLFSSCVALDKDNAECHLGLGTTWTKLGNPEKAAGAYREFLRLAPNHPQAREARKALQR